MLSAFSIEKLHEQLSSYNEIGDRNHFEETLFVLFNKIWLSDPFSPEESLEIKKLWTDSTLPFAVGCQAVSALILSLQSSFDKERLLLLFDAAQGRADEEIRVRALIGIMLSLYMYRGRTYLYPQLKDRLAALAEQPGFTKKLRTITLRFILAKETEKITRKLQNEIIPAMMKLAPDIKKMKPEDFDPELQAEKNPEWKELFADSSLGQKIEEYNELQQEGADVMHSTFTYLKNFPFFQEMSNWFLPFISNHTSFDQYPNTDSERKVLEITHSIVFMCNSDKYSFYFSMMRLPIQERTALVGQFNSQASEMLEQYKEEMISERGRFDIITGQYIQDIYRFFKLHPNHTDFEDIFRWPLDFYNLPILRPYLSDDESLTAIAEYYLKKNYFDESLTLYTQLAAKGSDNEMLYQKIGYCRQMLGDTSGALEAYLRADLLNTGSKWLIRRIAGCYRTLNQPEKALEYYRRCEALNPENLSVQMSIAHCYLEMKDYNDALKYYFKVDYLDAKSHKAWRPIAWCSFLTGKYDQAINYYEKIFNEDTVTMHDLMNAGHIAWALQDIKGAIVYYKGAVEKEEAKDFNVFKELFTKDIPHLLAAGIEDDEIPLVLDQLRYEI
jgi:tetratricopeptide (TPR) repeat protein